MANNLGLFQWIRNGVRQSVLQGVSDALDTIGTPEDYGKLHPALLSFSNSPIGAPGIGQTVEADGSSVSRGNSGTPNSRKRLGRSLKDIEQTKPST